MKFLGIVLVLSLIFVGCSGKHCVKIGGDYEGIQGNIEYCFDAGQSTSEGRPILVNKDTGDKLFGFSEGDLAGIIKILDTGIVKAEGVKESNCRQIVAKLRELKK